MSGRSIFRTPAAETDLLEIWLYVALDSPRTADRLLDQIADRINILADFPEVGAPREDIAEELRMLPVGSYVVLYRLVQSRVEIVRVVHGARDATVLF